MKELKNEIMISIRSVYNNIILTFKHLSRWCGTVTTVTRVIKSAKKGSLFSDPWLRRITYGYSKKWPLVFSLKWVPTIWIQTEYIPGKKRWNNKPHRHRIALTWPGVRFAQHPKAKKGYVKKGELAVGLTAHPPLRTFIYL